MKITIVIVVYNTSSENSSTFSSLRKVLQEKKEPLDDLPIIIYDNSPEHQGTDFLQFAELDITYIHDERNIGIATAYNYAWSIGKNTGSEWLLLLDHDTEITSEYLDKVLKLNSVSTNVAAVVPKVFSLNQMVSPVYSQTLRPLNMERPLEGIQEKSVMAINSGALVRLDFLNKIGGFNEEFPLDYLDHWLFYEIYAKGYKVWVLDVALEHELSVMDYSGVSLRRYQSILDSEINFYQNYKIDLYPSYRKQLAKRFVKQLLTVKNKKIAMYTLKRYFSM